MMLLGSVGFDTRMYRGRYVNRGPGMRLKHRYTFMKGYAPVVQAREGRLAYPSVLAP